MTRRIAGCAGMVGVALVLASTGCRTERTRPTHAATVRDSAGVEIVESSAPAWARGTGWRLSDTPRVSIGVVEGDPHYQLSRVRGAAKLTDGRIVIANGGSRELRFYDAAGTYLSALGRKGSGPGEFTTLTWMARVAGDSLVAFDSRSRSVSVFDASGHFVRSSSVLKPEEITGPYFIQPVGRFADGSWAVRATKGIALGGSHKAELIRDSVPFLHADATGAVRDTIGQLPGSAVFTNGSGASLVIEILPFGRGPHSTMHGNDIYLGSPDRYEIGVYAPDGTLRRLIRRTFENQPVTPADIDAVKRQRLSEHRARNPAFSDDARAGLERAFAQMPIPKTMPAYGALQVDAEGNLWVEDYHWPLDAPPRWTVFDTTGHMLGELAMPERFTPLDIGTDYVLGTWRDDLDVEHVRLYALEKGEPSARVATVPRR